jgi:hypothetical protein
VPRPVAKSADAICEKDNPAATRDTATLFILLFIIDSPVTPVSVFVVSYFGKRTTPAGLVFLLKDFENGSYPVVQPK